MANQRVSVDSIRPAQFNALMEEASQKDAAWWRENIQKFEKARCPLCNTEKSEPSYTVSDYCKYKRCDSCHTLYLDPAPTYSLYSEFYSNSAVMNAFSKYIFPNSNDSRAKNIYVPRLERMVNILRELQIPELRYLEIGAGSGAFTKIVQDSNFFSNVVAVEPNIELYNDCTQKGIFTVHKTIENATQEDLQRSNIIGCFEALEHIKNPSEFLEKVYHALPQGGVCFFTTPNGYGIDILELGNESTTLGITHCNIFNTISVRSLFEKVGFSVLSVETPGVLDVDLVRQGLMKKADGRQDGWLKFAFELQDDNFMNALQNFVVENKFSSHMWVVACKR